MVEPCRTSASVRGSQCARRRLRATPAVGSAETVDVFDVTTSPSMTPTRSVNVPPISTPTIFIVPGPSARLHAAVHPAQPALDDANAPVEYQRDRRQRSDESEERSRVVVLCEHAGEKADP